MQLEILIWTAVLFGALGLVFSVFSYRRNVRCMSLLEFAEKQIIDLDDDLSELKGATEKSMEKLSEQTRRIAWLESRLRQPKLHKKDVIEDDIVTEPARPTMTERRHRVMTLAARGATADSIAASLGMLRGEVELIISLNRSVVAA